MRVNVFSLVILLSTAVVSGVGRSRRIAREPGTDRPGRSDPTAPGPDPNREPYSGVILVLLAAALLGMAAILAASWKVANLVLLDTGVILLLSAGILVGVFTALTARGRAPQRENETPDLLATAEAEPAVAKTPAGDGPQMLARLADARARIGAEVRDLDSLAAVRVATAVMGVMGIGFVLAVEPTFTPVSGLLFATIAGFCLAAAGLALTAARYLGGIEPGRFPESPWLCRGSRVVAWVFVLAAVSMGLLWAGQSTLVRAIHFAIVGLAATVCFGLFTARHPKSEAPEVFPLTFPVLEIFGSRTNILGSILDAAEQRLGIDIRSTWALTVVRRSLEPLVISLVLVAWLSTALTVVGLEEQGLIEHFGVPAGGQALAPGLHLHWPFPIDRVFRLPVQRVQTTTVGHEGQEEGGPENVLWAVEHAANEYTLLLGNGRDLITVDAAVQYRIADSRAWRYHCQNPADALRAIAYRAVMRSTVNLTLSEALSENVATLTANMRQMVQQDADALGLGVEVVAFTVGGMHPPVAVASDYQAVVSAEISKVTAVVNAQVFRNQTVPATDAAVLTRLNTAQADGVRDLARAAGEAWSFRTLESQYRTEPQEYLFRRRLETMERNLAGRRFTVVDSRFQQDGGELWLIP
jgi:regulator of protease activity HflC (stomatin/prohibitin superfamily)